jgi:CRISPR-associated protein Cmr2
MPEAVLIFTFGPVQGFISEARRTSDLFAGSIILGELAKAAAQAIQANAELVYPSSLGADVPNVLVAVTARNEIEEAARRARQALIDRWHSIAQTARARLGNFQPTPDGLWQSIWDRQVNSIWEVYWAASFQQDYKFAYEEAHAALDATKRTRAFPAAEELGPKDSLSGCRSALRTGAADARDYWNKIGQNPGLTAAKLRPDGRERLDAIGAIKRFSDLAEREDFPSTSTVASQPFLEKTRPHLAGYRKAVESLLGQRDKTRPKDADWPYDGDLLFLETLAAGRLRSSYDVQSPDQQQLEAARQALRALYDRVDDRPSPYYAVIVLDGDDMGHRISACLEHGDPREAHRELSSKLASFATQVPAVVEAHRGARVYNGGDDVLALAPLSTAFELARQLAATFQSTTSGWASAGLAVLHHLYPLGAALRAARAAEKQAKQITGKAAVCIHVLSRSGDAVEMRSPWRAVDNMFSYVVRLFQEDSMGRAISSRLAYDVCQAGHVLPEASERSRAELKRLINRHRNAKHPQAPPVELLTERLYKWAQGLPRGMEELGQWLLFARFVAQGGRE